MNRKNQAKDQSQSSNLAKTQLTKLPHKLIKRLRHEASVWLNSPFQPISFNRFRAVRVLLKYNHPLIAARVLLPGLFIGTMGSLAMVISLNSHPFHVQAVANTANVFVSANGSDTGTNCIRFATATTNPDPTGASLCQTFDKAYQLASPGDTVEVEQGSYSYQLLPLTSAKAAGSHCDWAANDDIYNPVPDFSGCITFVPGPGATVTLGGLGIEVPYLRLDGGVNQSFRFDRTSSVAQQSTNQLCGIGEPATCTYGSAIIATEDTPRTNEINCYGDSTNGNPQMQSHDIVLQNLWSNDAFTLRGSHVSIQNSTFDLGDSWRPDSADSHINACSKTGSPAMPSQYLQLSGVTVKNLLMNHAPNQSGATSWQLQHLEGIHFEGGQHVAIENSSFLNLAQYDIFLETEDATPSQDILFQNNVFDPVCSHQPNVLKGDGACDVASGGLAIDCHNGNTGLADVTARFNTFLWSAGGYGNSLGWYDDSPCAYSGSQTDYGNLFMGAAPSTFGCSTWASSIGVIPDHDMWSSGSCGTNAITGDTKIADAADYDAHLGTGSLAIDAVSSGGTNPVGCPATDYYGNSRPQGSACDAGADEYIPTANVWVSTTGDDSTCARANSTKPCLTFNQAYAIAQPGDKINIAAGSYPAQELSGTKTGGACNGTDGGTSNACVTFEPATGATVTVAGMTIGASYIKIEGITNSGSLNILDSTCGSGSPKDVVVQNMTGTDFFIDGGTNITISGGSFGPVTDAASNIQACDDYYAGTYSSNVLISGVTFHDYHYVTAGTHMECLHISSENGLTVRDSVFKNCGIFDINFNAVQLNGPVTIENSTFDTARGMNDATSGGSSDLGLSPMSDLTVRFNSFLDKWADEDYGNAGDTYTNTNIYGNVESAVIDSFHCASYINSGIVISYNVSSSGGVACGTGSVMADNQFKSEVAGAEDFHLASSSVAAVNLVPAAQCIASDFDGDSRPQGSACDAGADEYLASYIPPGNDSSGPSDSGSSSSSSGSSSSASLKGDCNNDGIVNLTDLSILLSHYGTNYSPADFDSNGQVSLTDLSILLSNYGK